MKIVEKKKIFYTISLSVIVLGLIFMAYYKIAKNQDIFNFGIEFKGGTVVNVNLGQEYDVEDVKEIVLGVTGDKNAQVQQVIGSNEVIVKLSAESVIDAANSETENVEADETDISEELVPQEETFTEPTEETSEDGDAIVLKPNSEVIAEVLDGADSESSYVDLVLEAFEIKYGTTEESLVELSDFDATVGGEMTTNALVSVFLACIAILIYITFRFKDSKMGIAALIALCHDVLVVLAIYAIFRLPIGNSFIAAILTIVGYSINNTIVIFDRIRENSKGSARTHKNTLINKSISETMTRTINTSITTLLSILALYFLGVDSIKEFTLPLIAGILTGTWSSVTIAGPVWYDLIHFGKNKQKKSEAKTEDVKEDTKKEKAVKSEKAEAKKITKNPAKAARKNSKKSKK